MRRWSWLLVVSAVLGPVGAIATPLSPHPREPPADLIAYEPQSAAEMPPTTNPGERTPNPQDGALSAGLAATGIPEVTERLRGSSALDRRWPLMWDINWPISLAAMLGLDGHFPQRQGPVGEFRVVRDEVASRQPARVGGTGPSARADWFYHQRAYPLAAIPDGARQRALAQAEKIAEFARPGKAGANSPWTLAGPAGLTSQIEPTWGQMSGRVRALAIDRTNPNRLLLGTATGGVWLSSNAGGTWTPLTDNQPSLAIGAVAIDPNNPNVFYAGTGEGNGAYYSAGILKSTNGGASWTVLGGSTFNRGAISGIAISPQNGNVLVVCARNGSTLQRDPVGASVGGIYRSTNGGQTFTRVFASFCTGLTVVPDNFNVMYHSSIGIGASNGLYRSLDAGVTWTLVSAVVNGSNVRRLSVGVSRNGAQVYVGGEFETAQGDAVVLQRSFDGGSTWSSPIITAIAPPDPGLGNVLTYCEKQCDYNNVISINPFDSNDVWFGGVGLYRSRDSGNTAARIGNNNGGGGPLHVDHHVLMFDPVNVGIVYSGNDGGIYRSSNGGTSWTSIGGSLATLQHYHISLHPTNPSIIFSGNQDNGTTRRNGSNLWTEVLGGDGAYSAIDFNNPQIVYASGQRLNVRKSFDGGLTFATNVSPPIPSSQDVGFIAPLIMDPVNPAILYGGSDRIWITADGGASWPLSTVRLVEGAGETISHIAVSPTDPVAYSVASAGTVARVELSTGTALGIDRAPLPPRYATSVIVHPTDANTVYVGFSGFNDSTPSTPGHVFKTTNGGASWTNVSANLPDVPVNALALRPNQPTEIYAGTDVGVFISLDGGGSWAKMNNGLPNVGVASLAVNGATNLLAAGTYGRSVWTTPLAASAGSQTLTVAKSGSGNGTVTSNPAGINCGSTCSASFTSGAQVTLSASAGSGSSFTGWSGCDSVTATTCTLSLNAARNVTASFAASGGGGALDEPSASGVTLPTPNPPNASCPSGFFIAAVGDGPGPGVSNGAFGMELLLDQPGTRKLAGGLNFGALVDVSQRGFAAVNIANSANENQRLSVSLTGARNPSGPLPARVIIERRSGGNTVQVFQTDVTLTGTQPFQTSIVVPAGFYVASVAPLGFGPEAARGEPEGRFLFSLTTSFVDRPGGGFQGGAVVGGYHATSPFGARSGFAGFCLATQHSVSLRVLSAPSYGAAGARDLRLQVLDAQQAPIIAVPSSAGVGNVAPTANFSFSTNSLTANFSDTSTDTDGTIASRNWGFGDGSTSTATNPTRTYAAAGTYTVTLTVTDNGGATGTTSRSVTVASGGGGGTSQLTCADLDGAYLLAQDPSATYLGFFGSRFAPESIMNEFGPYGSATSSSSVRNELGSFGNSTGPYSAQNSLASLPPRIRKNGAFLAYLSTNILQPPRVTLAFIDENCTFNRSSPLRP
jgi:hypothetical protein